VPLARWTALATANAAQQICAVKYFQYGAFRQFCLVHFNSLTIAALIRIKLLRQSPGNLKTQKIREP